MPKRNLIWLAVTVLVAALAVSLARVRPGSAPPSPTAGPFEPLVRLDALAHEYYVEEVPPEALTGAIRGYLRALDPYCRYVRPEQPDYLDQIIHGRRCDLGIRYQIAGGRVRVLGVLPGSPAAVAGVRGDDVLLSVDGVSLSDTTRQSVQQRLSGPAGKPLRLVLRRGGTPLMVEAAPAEYDIETVTGLARGPDGRWRHVLDERARIAYIRIPEFATGTAEAFDAALRGLLEQGLSGLVLDLRDNDGGPLEEAVAVADRFLDDGLIVLTRGRAAREERHMAHPGHTLPADMPVVVLVNGRTVSAAELLAGALKTHRRALLVGTPTFGKDGMLRPFALGPDMGTVVLTTARYYLEEPDAEDAASAPAASSPARPATAPSSASAGPRPSGPAPRRAPRSASRTPRGGPVVPHLVEELGQDAQQERQAFWYRMEALPPPPAPATGSATTRPSTALSDWAADEVDRLRQVDTQLARAVRLLRHPEAFEAFLGEDP